MMVGLEYIRQLERNTAHPDVGQGHITVLTLNKFNFPMYSILAGSIQLTVSNSTLLLNICFSVRLNSGLI